MRHEEFIHWSEGLFLQPHHFQQLQGLLTNQHLSERSFYMHYADGLCDFEIDHEALNNRRIVIKRLSAILPDGTGISMPGNCTINPLTVPLEERSTQGFTAYLALQFLSQNEPNVSEDGSTRYAVHERHVIDENTSDNEISIPFLHFNVQIVTDPDKAKNCVLLPIARLRWVAVSGAEAGLAIDKDYMPPFNIITTDCPLLSMADELLFQLKSCKNKILLDLEQQGFEHKFLSGVVLAKVMTLNVLNTYIAEFSTLLVPGLMKPIDLYLKLRVLLSQLCAINPLGRHDDAPAYNHYDLLPIIKEIMTRIRSIVVSEGELSYLKVDFVPGQGCLEAALTDEQVAKGEDYYISIFAEGIKDKISQVEDGDNLRLIDAGSLGDRVRGLKLSYLRYPPQFLPNTPDCLWFKVMRDQAPRVWKYIVDDHKMVIDFAGEIFPGLRATVYMSISK
ncbi:MAG: type VI secretion system baseplate subunit TssK [Succinivibrionaceae bacterium]|nr:type VI secretion system baseplate subunit TssK [Succinivibrionaceae bacterium]